MLCWARDLRQEYTLLLMYVCMYTHLYVHVCVLLTWANVARFIYFTNSGRSTGTFLANLHATPPSPPQTRNSQQKSKWITFLPSRTDLKQQAPLVPPHSHSPILLLQYVLMQFVLPGCSSTCVCTLYIIVFILILSLPCVRGVIGGTKVRRVKTVVQLNLPSTGEIRALCNYKNCARIPLQLEMVTWSTPQGGGV